MSFFFFLSIIWSTVKQVGLYFRVFLYINQRTSGHRWELICENVCSHVISSTETDPSVQMGTSVNFGKWTEICRGTKDCSWPQDSEFQTPAKKTKNQGTSLAVQRLRFCASTARGVDSIPGQGTKIPHAAWPQTPLKRKRRLKENLTLIMPRVQSSKL